MSEEFEVFRRRKMERQAKRYERRREAVLHERFVEEALPPGYHLQNPSEGVYQIREGMGPVRVQWWPGRASWTIVSSQKIMSGDLRSFLDFLRRGDEDWV